MDSVVTEQSSIVKIIESNIDFYKAFWTDTYPVQTRLGQNVILDWLPHEDKININPVYKNVEIKYHINNHGYRYYPNNPNKGSKKAFCFGCSFTLGHGLPDNETWPYILNEKLGKDWSVYNFGVYGSSFEEMARIFYQVIKSTPKEEHPAAVFFLLPDFTRKSYIGNKTNKKPVYTNIVLKKNPEATYEAVIEELKTKNYTEADIKAKAYSYFSSVQCFFDNVMIFNLVREICAKYNIPWFWYTWSHIYWSLPKEIIAEYMCTENTVTDDNGLKIIDIKPGKSRDSTHCDGYRCEQYANMLYTAYTNYEKSLH